jgi:membrane protein DedA with SNARE-associated domain
VLWGTTIGVAGYLLGSSWDRLVYFARDVDLAALIAATVVALILVARALLGRRRARPAR